MTTSYYVYLAGCDMYLREEAANTFPNKDLALLVSHHTENSGNTWDANQPSTRHS